jgi:hypothetical protein
MPVAGVARLERFFRVAASLDADKQDLKRFGDFLNDKIYDLLVVAQETAGANGRDVVEVRDLPITKGLRDRMREFRRIDQEAQLGSLLDDIAAIPQLDLAVSVEVEEELPLIAGGLSLALVRTFPIIDPNVRNPQTEQWERAQRVFDLLL